MTDVESKLRKRAEACRLTGNHLMAEEFDGYADALSSLQGDNEVLRLQLAAKRSTFVDAEVSSLQEELGRVRGALRAGADIVSGTWDGVYDIDDEINWVKEAEAVLGVDAADPRDTSAIGCADEGGK
jgi:phage-related minor tail protein